MELARLVIPKGKEYPNHKVSGPILVHCIQGKIEVNALVAIWLLYHCAGLLELDIPPIRLAPNFK